MNDNWFEQLSKEERKRWIERQASDAAQEVAKNEGVYITAYEEDSTDYIRRAFEHCLRNKYHIMTFAIQGSEYIVLVIDSFNKKQCKKILEKVEKELKREEELQEPKEVMEMAAMAAEDVFKDLWTMMFGEIPYGE